MINRPFQLTTWNKLCFNLIKHLSKYVITIKSIIPSAYCLFALFFFLILRYEMSNYFERFLGARTHKFSH